MRQQIGLDIGGTKITGVVFDGKTVLRELTVPTPKNLSSFKETIIKLITFLKTGRQISALGVGIAGIVGPKGTVIYSPNIKFLVGFNIGKFIKELNFIKFEIENDANCFALCESEFGKGKQFKNFVGITLGTGIGGGIISNKKIIQGSHGSAGEAGHMMADFKYDSEHYFQLAKKKNDYKKMGEIVGLLFANIVNLLDVEAIILGGTLSTKHFTEFSPFAKKKAKKHIVNKAGMPKILVSNLKNASAIGAALLVQN